MVNGVYPRQRNSAVRSGGTGGSKGRKQSDLPELWNRRGRNK